MSVTPAYAAVFALVFVALSVRTLRLRHRLKIAIGHGDQAVLERAARAHANFAEYVPLTLILVFFLESMTGRPVWIHALCLTLLVGRVVHAYGVSQVREDYRFRVTGMALTFTTLVSSAIAILVVSALHAAG
jgi:uncharacterized membrane protein YecN with MAPEG domain